MSYSSSTTPSRTRWHYERRANTTTEETYFAVSSTVPPMILTSDIKYTRMNIPVPRYGRVYRDIVLGVKVNNLQLINIEAIVVSVDQTVKGKVLFTCEVITPRELEHMCAPTNNNTSYYPDEHDDQGIMKWKLKERLLESEGEFSMAIEVKTWDGAPPYYGSIEIYWVETHIDARAFYQYDPLYSEHQPYMYKLAVDNTGRPEIDNHGVGTMLVESYVYSKQGAYVLVSVRTKPGVIIQLWQIRDLPSSDPRSVPQLDNLSLKERDCEKTFRPKMVAWMYLADVPESRSIDVVLSYDGTQLAIVDENVPIQDESEEREQVEDEDEESAEAERRDGREGGETSAEEEGQGGEKEEENGVERGKKESESWTAFYKFTPDIIGTGETPAGATSGSGLVRMDVEKTCPGLANFFGRSEFHIVATTDQDVKDEILVACDGVTIEVYSVFGEWSHIRTIVIDPTRNSPSFRRNVFAALFKQLRGKYMLLVDAGGTKVTTWNIETGEAVASSTRFGVSEFWALRHLANVTRDGRLVAVPGHRRLEIYETATWDMMGWYQFPDVGFGEFVSEGLFIRGDSHIMVTVDSERRPFYRNNRGFIIDLGDMTVVEYFASAGHGRFELLPKMDPEEEQLFLAVDTSSAWEVSDLVTSGPKVTETAVDDSNDEDSDDETSALSIHHQTLSTSPGGDTAADEDETQLSDGSSRTGTGFLTDEEDGEDSGPVRQWFFKDLKTESSLPAQQLELVPGHVNININPGTETQRIEWQIPVENISKGRHEVILGISSKDLDLKAVDSITFDYFYGANLESSRPSEVIPSSALKTLFVTSTSQNEGDTPVTVREDCGSTTAQEDDDTSSMARDDGESFTTAEENGDDFAIALEVENESTVADGDGGYSDATAGDSDSVDIDPVDPPAILRWKLHEKVFVKSRPGGTIRVVMTIESWKGVSQNPGAIGLHFLELYKDSLKSYENDASYRRHNPFAWFIDVNARTESPHNGTTKKIFSYHFSGDGACVALLTHSTKGQHLDLYHIDQDVPSTSLVTSWKLSSSRKSVFDISVSWDGSQVVVLDLAQPVLSTVYTRDKPKKTTRASSSMASSHPGAQYSVGRSHSKISRQCCRGTFYVPAPAGPGQKPPKDERFVTFDGVTMSIYSVHGKWKRLDRRTIGRLEDSTDDSKWKNYLRADRLVLEYGNGMYVSTQSLTGTNGLIAAMDLSTTESDHPYVSTCLSACGIFFAMASKEHIVIYLTETWTRLGSWSLPDDGDKRQDITNVYFVCGNKRIVVNTTSELGTVVRFQGYVVDIGTLTTIGRIHSRDLHPHSHTPNDSTDSPVAVLLYRSQTTFGAIRHTDRLIRSAFVMTAKCNNNCVSMDTFQPPSSPVFQAEVVIETAEPRDRRKAMPMTTVAVKEADSTYEGVIEFPSSEKTSLLGIQRSHFDDHTILVIALKTLVLVWRIPKSHDGDYELLLAEESMNRTKWAVCQHYQLHRRERSGIMSTTNLLDPHVRNSDAFLDGIVRLAEIFKDLDDKSKRGIAQYIERHINQRLSPEDDSAAILTRLCSSWNPKSHECLLVFIGALCRSPSFRWVPTLGTDQTTNPILILLSHLQNYLYVIDIVEVMVKYCIRQAKADSDLRFLEPVFHSLRIALQFHKVDSGLISRALRSFAYLPAREYYFAIDHNAIASTPFESDSEKMLHEWKDPLLQLTRKPAGVLINERLTPHLYVASYEMLWTAEEIPIPKRKVFAILQTVVFFVTSTSRKRYVCHPFELQDLDNPALVALVRYKWMKFGLVYWLLKTVFYGYIAGFFLFTVLWDIYSDNTATQYMEIVRKMNIALSWIYALGSLRELFVLSALKMKSRGSVYKFVEILASLIPTIGYLTESRFMDEVYKWEYYRFTLCFGVLFLMLQFILEFRVMRKVGSFLSVMGRTFRSISVLLLIFLYLITAYAISFLYLQYGVCIDGECSNRPNTKPDSPLMALTLTYFMTGGLYEMAEDSIKERNWMTHVLLATFIFSVTIMLNILFGMVNHAFDSDGRHATLEWMENRMHLVTRAENSLRGIPFISKENSLRFPKRIYYTATPQQVRDYRAESQRRAKEAASAALPLETDSQDNDSTASLDDLSTPKYVVAALEKQALQPQPQQQKQQDLEQEDDQREQAQFDRMKEDLRTELNEEFREKLEVQERLADERLEAQRKQSDEQIKHVQTQLDEILSMMKAAARS
ncbi:hypothetical protein BGZ96_012376 [Linnemannia gamsii]|uniref:Ion transport domain-containing protein n=1 Tax=Linnemannia gamsii TaxID=64522 RepID=A0ABQ7KBB6_9FUNG|nr:hypothetical protein BGZ96_012376 [Linnemannia gamsii]